MNSKQFRAQILTLLLTHAKTCPVCWPICKRRGGCLKSGSTCLQCTKPMLGENIVKISCAEVTAVDERQQAELLADAVLDRPHIDPDGELCLLARQFRRALERESDLRADVRTWHESYLKANAQNKELRARLARAEDAIRSAHVFGKQHRTCPFCETHTANDVWPSNHKFDCIILTLEK